MLACLIKLLTAVLVSSTLIMNDNVIRSVAAPLTYTVIARVINLSSRSDRWNAFQEAWSNVTAVHIDRFPALPHVRVHDGASSILVSGCARSHHAVVTRTFALEPNLPFLLVLEDDAVPMPGFDTALQEILDYAVHNLEAWDIINLGTSMIVRGKEEASFEYRSHRLLQSSVWSAAHALLVNRRAVPAYERMLESVRQHDLSEPAGRSDWTLSHDPFLVTLVSVPSIVRQAPGWSDMVDAPLDYSALFDEADRWLLLTRDGLEKEGWRTGRLIGS